MLRWAKQKHGSLPPAGREEPVRRIRLLAYHNSFSGPFVFDDPYSITENPAIRQLWPIWVPLSPPVGRMQGRPIPSFTLAINYALGGLEVWGYHLLNLIIHILAGATES